MLENKIAFNPEQQRQIWELQKEFARSLIDSKAVPSYIQNEHQALVVMQAGTEMGFQFIESTRYLYIVGGLITLTGQGATRRMREAGYTLKYKDEKNKCTVSVYSGEKEVSNITVTYEEAVQSGYTKTREGKLKTAWKEGMNRRVKLGYLAVSTLVKREFPEVLGSAVDITEVAVDYPEIEEQEAQIKNSTPKKDVKKEVDDFLNNVNKKIDEKEKERKSKEKPEKKDNTKKANEEKNKSAEFTKYQKEYFALANDMGINAEEAKEKIKAHFKVDSFMDLKEAQLKVFIKALRAKKGNE